MQEVAAHGDTKATVVSHEGLRFDLRVVPPESYGNLLQHFTGSKEHNVAMREEAVRRGLSISEYGVTDGRDRRRLPHRGRGRALRVPRLPADPAGAARGQRRARGGAARRASARSSSSAQVRGDLHTHTHWSADGKSTLEEMVEAAIARGYAYYAITDHSHYLRDGRLARAARGDRAGARARIRSCGSSPASRRTSARTARSTSPRRTSRCSTGSSPRSTRRRRRARRSACSPRWRTRTSTASAT